MAVCKVKKLELVAHAHCRGEILTTLRRLGSVHISNVTEFLPEAENAPPAFLEKTIEQMESRLSRKRYCLEFLDTYIPKPSFTESLLKGKPVFTAQELQDSIANFNADYFYDQCKEIEREIAECEGQIDKNESLMETVAYWRDLEFPIESIRDTATTCIRIGLCDTRAYGPMMEEVEEASPLFYDMVVDRSRTSVSTLVAYHKNAEDTVAPILRQHGWRAVSFPDLTGTPAEVLDGLQKENAILRERTVRLRERIGKDLVSSRDTLLLLIDHYTQELETLRVQHNFLFTSRAFLITGWVVASKEAEMRRRIEETTDIVEMRCSDPGPDDNIPILINNPRLIEPFALVTELYGRPQYSEFDPTPLLAPFFAAFFGICLGDGGYGLILAAGSLLALKKLPLEGGARRLVQILLASGIATTIFGFISGGVFGIEAAKLPPVLKSLMIFNPTTDIIGFLYLSFAIGIFQIVFGIGVKLVRDLYDGDIVGAVFEQGVWIFFIISITPLGFKYLFGGEVGENIISLAFKGTMLFEVLIIVFGARQIRFKVRSIAKRIGLGSAGALGSAVDYGLSTVIFLLGRVSLGFLLFFKSLIGYFGDVLSYSRLMALGLATAFLGMVVNQMAAMALDIPYGIGFVFFILILIFGHAFNLVVNCLSAFVHTLRLQYLEFFSKFFVGGGKPFKPFAEERKYTSIQELG